MAGSDGCQQQELLCFYSSHSFTSWEIIKKIHFYIEQIIVLKLGSLSLHEEILIDKKRREVFYCFNYRMEDIESLNS